MNGLDYLSIKIANTNFKNVLTLTPLGNVCCDWDAWTAWNAWDAWTAWDAN